MYRLPSKFKEGINIPSFDPKNPYFTLVRTWTSGGGGGTADYGISPSTLSCAVAQHWPRHRLAVSAC